MSLIEGWIRVNVLDTGQKASRRGHGTKAGLHFPPRFRIFGYVLAHTFQKIEKKKREKESGKVVGMMG